MADLYPKLTPQEDCVTPGENSGLDEETQRILFEKQKAAQEEEEKRLRELEEEAARLAQIAASAPGAVAQKRCKRFGCGAFYTDATNGECVYHTQEFRPLVSLRQGTQVGWLCCRVKEWLQVKGVDAHPVINEAALKRSYPGCARAPLHLEDEVYTRCMAQFPLDTAAAVDAAAAANVRPRAPVEPEIDPSDPNAEAKLKEFNDANAGLLPYTLHKVSNIETLAGIALRYNVTVSSIQKLNRLNGQQIHQLKFIRIPKSEAEVAAINAMLADRNSVANEAAALRSAAAQAQLRIKLFRKRTGVHSNEEAKYYLHECQDDVDQAIEMYKEDLRWEEENKHLSPEAKAQAEKSQVFQARKKRRESCFCFAQAFDPLDD